MEEKNLSFSFEARYYQLGNLDQNTRQAWVVLHGYGQLAQYFLRKFKVLAEKDICILAPEGLSRFYLSELTEQGRKDNKVGATWMTRENRLADIQNYIRYLDGIWEKELKDHPNLPVTILGFSQGSATACRWATQGKVRFERLILWAGLFPPDMDFASGHNTLASKRTYLVAGKSDPYLTDERMNEFDELASKLGITPEKILFDGAHEMNDQVLLTLT